jgi:mRNA interferase MazF
VIESGDIRWFRFATPDKRRPVLVLGRRDLLPSLAQVPIIPLSTHARGLAWEVPLSMAEGLPSACVLKPEWIRNVERALLGPLIARLPDQRWAEVRATLLDVLGLAQCAQALRMTRTTGGLSAAPPLVGDEGSLRSNLPVASLQSGPLITCVNVGVKYTCVEFNAMDVALTPDTSVVAAPPATGDRSGADR